MEPTQGDGSRPSRSAVRWAVIGLVFLASLIAYILRTNVSVAGNALSQDLGFSRIQLGLVLGAFAWGYAIFQFPGGVLGDRFGARRALTVIAVAWGLLNLLVGLMPAAIAGSVFLPLGTLILLRFLMGAAQAPLFPVVAGGAIRNWFPFAAWGVPNALTNAGLAFGSAATGPLIAWLIVSVGWRQSFVLTAPLGLGIAGLWWWYYRDQPAEHRGVSPGELRYITGGRAPEETAPAEPGSWRRVLRDRNVRLITLSYFCNNYLFYFFFNWLVIYLVESRQLTLLQGGWYAAAPWMTGAIGALAGGAVNDRLTGRYGATIGSRWPILLAMVGAGALLLGVSGAPNAVTAVVLLSLCLGLQQFTDPIYWTATMAVAGRYAGSACGVLNTGGNLVGGIGALLVPITVEALGWPAALGTTALVAMISGVMWLWIRVEEAPERGD